MLHGSKYAFDLILVYCSSSFETSSSTIRQKNQPSYKSSLKAAKEEPSAKEEKN
jgi:hypothetical protein